MSRAASASGARPIRRTGAWRKSIFVADDDATAKRYATDPNGPYRYYYSQLLKKLQRGGRAIAFKTDPKQADEDVSLDAVCEKLVFWGSPNRVADQILAFREEVGDFGTLLLAGKDWKDRELGRRNMVLLAEKVLPQVNAAIGKRKVRRSSTAIEVRRILCPLPLRERAAQNSAKRMGEGYPSPDASVEIVALPSPSRGEGCINVERAADRAKPEVDGGLQMKVPRARTAGGGFRRLEIKRSRQHGAADIDHRVEVLHREVDIGRHHGVAP